MRVLRDCRVGRLVWTADRRSRRCAFVLANDAILARLLAIARERT